MSQASREGLGRALQVEAEHEQEGAGVPVSHMQLVFLDLEVLTGDLASVFLPMKRSLVWWVGLEVLGRGEAGMILPILRVWVADGTFKTCFLSSFLGSSVLYAAAVIPVDTHLLVLLGIDFPSLLIDLKFLSHFPGG